MGIAFVGLKLPLEDSREFDWITNRTGVVFVKAPQIEQLSSAFKTAVDQSQKALQKRETPKKEKAIPKKEKKEEIGQKNLDGRESRWPLWLFWAGLVGFFMGTLKWFWWRKG